MSAVHRTRIACAFPDPNPTLLHPRFSNTCFLLQAAEESVISSSGAEVWKIDPSDGSLYVVTKRLQGPTDSPRLAGERSSPRQLKVQVTAAELLPAITGKL